jgi:hypothetical protein
MVYGYLVVIQDNASDNYSYGIPDDTDAPKVIFTSYEDAKVALESAAENFNEFLPVAYGKAYPYDTVTFEEELEAKDFAPFGWGIVETEDSTVRICIGLLRMEVN